MGLDKLHSLISGTALYFCVTVGPICSSLTFDSISICPRHPTSAPIMQCKLRTNTLGRPRILQHDGTVRKHCLFKHL